MNFISFLLRGAQMNEGKYDRFNKQLYTQDSTEIVANAAVKTKFVGEITNNLQIDSQTPAQSIRTIDGVVKVISVLDVTRKELHDFWKNKVIKSLTFAVASIAAGGGVITLVATRALPALLGTATAIGLVGLAILCSLRSKEAFKQMQYWKDPISDYQNKRMQIAVEENPFAYIFKNQFKGALASPAEVKFFWDNWSHAFFTKYNAAETITDKEIDDFFAFNPLGASELQYAKTGQPEDENQIINGLSVSFNQIKDTYRDAKIDPATKNANIQLQKTKLLEANETARARAKEPVDLALKHLQELAVEARDTKISKFKNEYDKKINEINNDYNKTNKAENGRKLACDLIKEMRLMEVKTHFESIPIISEANHEYETLTAQYEFYHSLVIGHINPMFIANKNDIDAYAQQLTDRVVVNEKQPLSNFIPSIRAISNAFINNEAYIPLQEPETNTAPVPPPQINIPYEELYPFSLEYNPDNFNADQPTSQESYNNFFQTLWIFLNPPAAQ